VSFHRGRQKICSSKSNATAGNQNQFQLHDAESVLKSLIIWSTNFLSLWNPKVHCRVHKMSPLDPTLSKFNPVPIYYSEVNLQLCLSSGLFPSGLPTKIVHAFLISPLRAVYPVHFIHLHLIALIILGAA
jgi:hypothetical protein